MDKISEILNNIKDRLSNPLIFSFILSWLVYNWEITVALFWYDSKQINAEGFKSIFEFVNYKLNNKCFSTILPIGLAFLYTLGFPYLKQIIRVLNNRAIKWGDKNEAKYVMQGMTKEHIELKRNYDETVKKVIDKTDFIDKLHDPQIISGHWTRIKKFENHEVVEEIRISQYDIYLIKKFNRDEKESMILSFYFNRDNKKVFFSSENIETRKNFDQGNTMNMSYDVNTLYLKANGDFSGTENNYEIEYVKHKKTKPS